MSRSLFIAATGMQAQQLKIDVIANNLANVNTDGFKRSRAEFQDLMYQTMKSAGSQNGAETRAPTGLQVGLGVRPVATSRNFEAGDQKFTGNPYDLSIQGAGFFQVSLPSGEVAYTRAGALKVDSEGLLVTHDGYPLEPRITVPRDTMSVTVGADGTVSATVQNRSEPVEVGQITLASVLNPEAMDGLGQNLFRYTGPVSEVQVGTPGRDGLGALAQGQLETSNVQVVEEMIAMIVGQRAYEANSKVIQTTDRMLEDANRLR